MRLRCTMLRSGYCLPSEKNCSAFVSGLGFFPPSSLDKSKHNKYCYMRMTDSREPVVISHSSYHKIGCFS